MQKIVLILVTVFVVVASAPAATLLSEDFEGLTLGPYTSPTEMGGDGTDWTNVPPAGWIRDQGTTPEGNPVEFFGWTFHDRQSWTNTEGDQQRSAWGEGVGTVMVADPDAYDDGTPIEGMFYNVNIRTPAIPLNNVRANSVRISFSSSFRAEEPEIATLDVTFDGTNFTNLLTYDANDTANFPDGGLFNDPIDIAVNNPGAGTMQFRFGMNNASNDWWWAVDNVLITGDTIPEPSTVALMLLTTIAFLRRGQRSRLVA